MRKYILLITACLVIGGFTSCNDDKLGETLFPDTKEILDPESYTYKLDYFLQENYLIPYNVRFKYKMEDIAADMDYNLIPADYNKAVDMAILCKYLWLDVFKEIAGEDFVKMYIPKIVHLIGSPAVNPTSGTEELGVSENGLKITLYKINGLNVEDTENFTSSYFLTIYHEFTHIMHQTKLYPLEFNLISQTQYDANGWQKLNDHVKLSAGMITPYACKSVIEDVAETLANYVVLSPEKWDEMMEIANRGWEVTTLTSLADMENTDVEISRVTSVNTIISVTVLRPAVERDSDGNRIPLIDSNGNTVVDEEGNTVYKPIDPDGIDGKAVINQKLLLVKDWLKDSWGIDIEKLRAEVQKRKSELDITTLRKELDNAPVAQ